jgi:hypothetical protein
VVINGTSGEDLLNGTAWADHIHPGAGDDIVYAGDNVPGTAGNDPSTTSVALTVTSTTVAPSGLDPATADHTGVSSIKNVTTKTISGAGEDGDSVPLAEPLRYRGPVRMERHGGHLGAGIRILESKFESSRERVSRY